MGFSRHRRRPRVQGRGLPAEDRRPDACDRTRTSSKDPPKKYALKLVRNAKLPSGRRVKMTPAPFSIFATGEFKEEERFDHLARPPKMPGEIRSTSDEDPSRYYAARVGLCGKTIILVQAHEVYGDRGGTGGFELG